MKNSSMIFLIGLSLFVGCTEKESVQQKSISQQTHPNIILYIVDDLGRNDVGCYGNPIIKTPGIDALAKAGTRFTHAYCTTPSCSASRSVILTGLYNHANGQYGHSHFEFHFSALKGIKSLPVILDSVGYRTMQVGKFHVAPVSVFKFDEYYKRDLYDGNDKKMPGKRYPFMPFGRLGSPENIAEELREFISDKDTEPFFLYFCTNEPHHPFVRGDSDSIRAEEVIVPPHLPDLPKFRNDLAKYYMSAQRADKGLLRLMEILKETGQWENTIVIFTSDNGRPFPGAKSNLYDPGILMPFVIHAPGIENQASVSDALINFADITPTLLDFAGVDIDRYNFHGRSFRNQLNRSKSTGFDTTYASHTFHEIQMYYPMRMIRDRKYKFIWNLAYQQNFPMGLGTKGFINMVRDNNLENLGNRLIENYLRRPKYELYDLENDPEELVNLAGREKYISMVEHYKKRLLAFQNNTDDLWSIYQDYDLVEEVLK